MASSFDRFHVVLVEPQESLNIGSVARAMRNLGFRHLHLVAPSEYDRERAAITACWATPLLDAIQIHGRFEEAIADIEEVIGLSGRSGIERPHLITLPQWSKDLTERGDIPVTALVFGPEDNGLRQEHLDLCRRIIRIPSTVECPSFNLAQATLLVLYEITRAFPEAEMPALSGDAPTGNDYFHLDRLLDSVMRESRFQRRGTPAPIPGTVRSIFRRLPINRQEMGVLLGLFGKINTTLLRRPGRTESDTDT